MEFKTQEVFKETPVILNSAQRRTNMQAPPPPPQGEIISLAIIYRAYSPLPTPPQVGRGSKANSMAQQLTTLRVGIPNVLLPAHCVEGYQLIGFGEVIRSWKLTLASG